MLLSLAAYVLAYNLIILLAKYIFLLAFGLIPYYIDPYYVAA